MSSNSLTKIVLAFAAVAALMACPKKSAVGLEGPWRAVSLDAIEALPSQAVPTLNIDVAKKSVNGFAGCNRYFGNFEAEGSGKLRFDGLGSTKMACQGSNGEVEGRFFQILSEADGFALSGSNLLLKKGSKTLAVFEKA